MKKRDPVWDELKAHKKEKFDSDRAQFLDQANANDDGGWTKHTEYHWSRMVNGERLDYWPSRKKFQWKGRVRRELVKAGALILAEIERLDRAEAKTVEGSAACGKS